jgi:hypothetical protein
MTTIFGQEMSPTVAALVYVFLGVALVILVGGIWNYWNYARKIELFLERDNVNNNMMRQDLVDRYNGQPHLCVCVCVFFCLTSRTGRICECWDGL